MKELKLYLVTDRALCYEGDVKGSLTAGSASRRLTEIVRKAVEGGVTMVQLREKDIDTRTFIEEALELKALLKPLGVPLIINDRVDVALASDADGVHIGQSDMPYAMARKLLGPDKIIGLSVENFDQIAEANTLDVDYIGISPVFATPTKTDTAKPFGLDGLRKAVRLSTHPTVAIGGMNEQTAPAVMATGTDGIAVVSAIIASPDPLHAASTLIRLLTPPPSAQNH